MNPVDRVIRGGLQVDGASNEKIEAAIARARTMPEYGELNDALRRVEVFDQIGQFQEADRLADSIQPQIIALFPNE